MSMKYYYVGPYLKCYFHYEEKEVEVYGCSKCKTESYTQLINVKYCGNCGTLLSKYKKTKKVKSIEWYDLDDKFVDTGEVSFKGFDILRTNGEWSTREFQVDDLDSYQEIDSEMIIEEKEWMEEIFSKEIEYLKKRYDKVSIEWGVVASYS